MGLSTHVLDTMNGCPAAGMAVELFSTEGDKATLIKSLVLNHDGRTDAPLFDNNTLKVGTYRLTFDVAAYFKARGVQLPEPSFLNKVSLDFGVANVEQHYHVPLLVSPGATPPIAAPERDESLEAGRHGKNKSGLRTSFQGFSIKRH
jgi:5-hydroxyisourate hydrolase